MALTFQQALYGAGAFLALFGGTFAIMSSGPTGAQAEFFEALSYGFTASFFALFSGVLIGVGAALFIVGMLLGTKSNKAHLAGAFIFSVMSFLLGISAIANPADSTFPMLVVFFAGLASSGAFFISAALFGFSSALKKIAYGKSP